MRYKFIILFLLIGFVSKAQVYQLMPQYGYDTKRMNFDSTIQIPTFCGVPKLGSNKTNKGALAFDSCNNRFYYFNPKLQVWDTIKSADASLFVKYTDTAQMLSAYLRKIDTTNRFVSSVTKLNDSTIQVIKGTTTSNITISSVTSATRLITQVWNNTGATILRGSVVYISGRHSSNLPTIALAQGNSEANSYKTFALVDGDIADNSSGFVIQAGKILGLNLPTSSYTDGDILYLSPTVPGGYTTTKPLAPYHICKLGSVTRAHPTQGSIEIKIENGWQLDELSDVQIAAIPADSTLLQFSRVDSLWHDVSPLTAIGNRYLKPTDSISLSNRINTKLNISDTANMLSPYMRTNTANASFVTSVFRKTASDSVFFVRGGSNNFAFIDSAGTSISPANPTASVGLTAVNGTANTFMRSDAAPALSQSISPTWTGTHIFNTPVTTGTGANSGLQINANSLTTGNGVEINSTNASATGNILSINSSFNSTLGSNLRLSNSSSTGRANFSLINNNNGYIGFQANGSAYAGIPSLYNTGLIGSGGNINNLIFNTNGDLMSGGTGQIQFTTGGYNNNPTMIITGGNTGNVLIGTSTNSTYKLDVFGGNSRFTNNANDLNQLLITNTTSGTVSQSRVQLTSDVSSGTGFLSKYSSGFTPAYKTITAGNLVLYNTTAGNINILNDFSSGNINLTSGGASTAQVILFPTGNLAIGTQTDVASSLLTLESTTKGFLRPRMTTTQMNAISTPATGLSVFNTTDSVPYTYRGSTGGWQKNVIYNRNNDVALFNGANQRIMIDTTTNIVAGRTLTVEAGSTQAGGNSTFNPLSQGNRAWSGISSAPNGDIYAVVENGDIWKRTGGTGNFAALNAGNRGWTDIAVAPNGDLYATVFGGDIWKSTNAGTTFTALNATGTNRNWGGITVAPNGDIYASVRSGDIYISTNAGTSFTALSQTSRNYRFMAAASNGDIYVCVYGDVIYRRAGGTGNFTALPGVTARNWQGISVASNGDIYACTWASGDIYRQTGGSGDFIALNQTARTWIDVEVAPNGDIYASVSGSDIYLQSQGTANLNGGTLVLQSGTGKGTGTSIINFNTSTPTVSGNVLQTASTKMTILGNGNVGIGTTSPSAKLELSDTARGFLQTRMTTTQRNNIASPSVGLQVFTTTDSSQYVYRGTGAGWQQIANEIVNTASLNFPSTNAQNSSDLTITLTGAVDGDAVVLGVPNAAVNANSCFTAWVSAANTVTVRFNNYSSGSIDPAQATFRVTIIK